MLTAMSHARASSAHQEPACTVAPDRIRAILATACASRQAGAWRSRGRTAAVTLERIDLASSQLLWRIEGTPSPAWETTSPPFDIDIIGYNTVYRMRLGSGVWQGSRLVTPLPERVERSRHRQMRRAQAPHGIRARLHSPLRPALEERVFEVVDLSFSGLRVRCLPEDKLSPDPQVLRVVLETGAGERIHLRGEVRHVSPIHPEGTLGCGLSVVPVPPDADRWVRFVSQALSPGTRTTDEFTEEVWTLLSRSGYFDLAGKTSEQFTELKAAFEDVAQRAARAPRLFCHAVWPSERGVEATLSFTKTYQRSWLTHQIAKRPGKPPAGVQQPGRIMFELYLRAFEYPQSDPDFQWIVAYVEAENPWVARAHVQYAEQLAATGLVLARQVHVMTVSCHERSDCIHEGIEVGPATPQELSLLADTIAQSRPPCYVDALDLAPNSLSLAPVKLRWQEHGLERDRQILVARRDGNPSAAAVLEVGHLGTNLFRLLDNTRLFALARDGAATYPALLDEARAWYAERRRSSFLYLREDDGGDYVRMARLQAQSHPYLWLLSSRLLPDFLEHIKELTLGRSGARLSRQVSE